MSQAPSGTQPPEQKKPPTIQEKIAAIEVEISELEKKCGSFSMTALTQLKEQNLEYEGQLKRLNLLHARLHAVSITPFQAGDLTVLTTGLKEAAIALFTQMKVNPDQWKNLGS
jgi:hypothetical protein